MQLGNDPPILTRFQVVQPDLPTLLSPRSIRALGCVLDLVNRTVRTTFSDDVHALTFTTDTLSQKDCTSIPTATCKEIQSCLVESDLQKDGQESLSLLLREFSDVWVEPKAGKCTTIVVDFKFQVAPTV